MRICLVTPHPPRSYHGNGVTAARWAGILDELGHTVDAARRYQRQPADLLLALHARRSADSVRTFRARHPRRPIVLALTGTDLYPALDPSDLPVARLADRLVVLQRHGVDQLPPDLHERTWVIYQSVPDPPAPRQPRTDAFGVMLLAHLRPVKDPLLAAAAARALPEGSRIRISHAGTAIDSRLGEQAAQASREDSRYRWLGELPRPDALRLLAESRLLILTSRHEGGANAISEALAASVPVVATRIPGTVGMLGGDYPGYFEPGDAAGLAARLVRAETDAAWYGELRHRCAGLRPLVTSRRERESWRRLLAELTAA